MKYQTLLTRWTVPALLAGLCLASVRGDDAKKEAPPVLKYQMKSLDNKDVDLSKYEGKVLLIVNVASECGYTKQYKGLQQLHEKFGKDGLCILGFPCNQFGGQEPGDAEKIQSFCSKNYGVTFDLFAKIDVNGDKAAPLYQYLTKDADPKNTGKIDWNFEKFLIGRDGKVVGRYKSGVTPESLELNAAIEKTLSQK